jgi:hypothetical protein
MNKKIIYFVVAAAIFGIGGYFLYVNLAAEEEAPSVVSSKIVATDFATKIFSDEKFSKLESNIDLSIKVSQKGKTNPFMKF